MKGKENQTNKDFNDFKLPNESGNETFKTGRNLQMRIETLQ